MTNDSITSPPTSPAITKISISKEYHKELSKFGLDNDQIVELGKIVDEYILDFKKNEYFLTNAEAKKILKDACKHSIKLSKIIDNSPMPMDLLLLGAELSYLNRYLAFSDLSRKLKEFNCAVEFIMTKMPKQRQRMSHHYIIDDIVKVTIDPSKSISGSRIKVSRSESSLFYKICFIVFNSIDKELSPDGAIAAYMKRIKAYKPLPSFPVMSWKEIESINDLDAIYQLLCKRLGTAP